MKIFWKFFFAVVLTCTILIACSQEPTVEDLNKKANQLIKDGNISEAMNVVEETIKTAKDKYPPGSPVLIKPLLLKAMIYQNQKKWFDAEKFYNQALSVVQISMGMDKIEAAQVMNNLAGLYYAQAQYDRARSYYEKAWEIAKINYSDEDLRVQKIQRNIEACIVAKTNIAENKGSMKTSMQMAQDLVPENIKKSAIQRLAAQSIIIEGDLVPLKSVKIDDRGIIFPYHSIQKIGDGETDLMEVVVLFSSIKKQGDEDVYAFKECRVVSYESFMEIVQQSDDSALQASLVQIFPNLSIQ